MVEKLTLGCAQFARKLDALYEASAGRQDREIRLDSDIRTARRCGVAKSTLSAWRNGAPNKNRSAGMLKEKDILALAEEFSALTDGRVKASEAFMLWRVSSYTEFRRRLFAKSDQSVFAVLRERAPTLSVTLFAQGSGLGMISETLTPIAGEHSVEVGDRLSLQVGAKKGACLIVIGTGPDGRFLLAPSEAYDGRVSSSPETVPRDKSWRFTIPGPHTIHVIELSTPTPPVQRGRYDPMVLTTDQERTIIEDLLDPGRSGQWRRGEIAIFVHDLHAP